MPCPYCQFHRFWKLRRNHARCKRCRREWSQKTWLVPGIRASDREWEQLLDSFLRDRTLQAVIQETSLKRWTVHRSLTVVRRVMKIDNGMVFVGPVEIDDVYLGPRWHNRRPWQRTTKRGRGTDQQPLLGLFDRKTKQVCAYVIPAIRWSIVDSLIRRTVRGGAVVYTDTYTVYRQLSEIGFPHAVVDHLHHEYVRGDVSVNCIESFWGYVKRRFKVTGGLRRSRLHLYLAEWVWRWNHRHLSRKAKVKRLTQLLREQKFGGRTQQ